MSRETIAAAAVEVVADGCMAIYVKAVTSQAVGEDHLRMVVRDHLYKRRRG
jgi:hypothetical protein